MAGGKSSGGVLSSMSLDMDSDRRKLRNNSMRDGVRNITARTRSEGGGVQRAGGRPEPLFQQVQAEHLPLPAATDQPSRPPLLRSSGENRPSELNDS